MRKEKLHLNISKALWTTSKFICNHSHIFDLGIKVTHSKYTMTAQPCKQFRKTSSHPFGPRVLEAGQWKRYEHHGWSPRARASSRCCWRSNISASGVGLLSQRTWEHAELRGHTKPASWFFPFRMAFSTPRTTTATMAITIIPVWLVTPVRSATPWWSVALLATSTSAPIPIKHELFTKCYQTKKIWLGQHKSQD
jgi:hypothetical protein